ncbi:MAG: thiamine-phosphate kinase [Psychromonas sp.]|nr:thiamine-phosphate kinase [Psychromonas sp.]
MPFGEFDLIQTYFNHQAVENSNGVYLGIGDDCAILDIPVGYQLVVTTDTLVAGVHFFDDVDPYLLGYKSLAVNLSDLAAMGAKPKWTSLAITLPRVDPQWLAEFTRGFFALADKHNVTLVGGDTTKGPRSITICAKGIVKTAMALQRNAAKVDDLIVVSGIVGDAAIGLACKLKQLALSQQDVFIAVLEHTEPRIELGESLVGLASSCIDISDGLIQDLSHILTASHCSADIFVEKLPLSLAHKNALNTKQIDEKSSLNYSLNGGDDYELLFTIAQKQFKLLKNKFKTIDLTVIGCIIKQKTQQINLTKNKQTLVLPVMGWNHFKD